MQSQAPKWSQSWESDRSWKHRTATYNQKELQTTHISRLQVSDQSLHPSNDSSGAEISGTTQLWDEFEGQELCCVGFFWLWVLGGLDYDSRLAVEILQAWRETVPPSEWSWSHHHCPTHSQLHGKVCSGESLPGGSWVSCIQLSSISDDSRLWLCADFITQPLRMGQQNQLLCLATGSLDPPGKGNTHFYFIWPWESYRLTSLQANNFFFFFREEDPGHLPGSVS